MHVLRPNRWGLKCSRKPEGRFTETRERPHGTRATIVRLLYLLVTCSPSRRQNPSASDNVTSVIFHPVFLGRSMPSPVLSSLQCRPYPTLWFHPSLWMSGPSLSRFHNSVSALSYLRRILFVNEFQVHKGQDVHKSSLGMVVKIW